jgi:hypothetical protein
VRSWEWRIQRPQRDCWCDGRPVCDAGLGVRERQSPGSRVVIRGFIKRCRRRPTLPRPRGRSTIGAVGLNDRVRNGNECGPDALVASEFSKTASAANLTASPTDSQWNCETGMACNDGGASRCGADNGRVWRSWCSGDSCRCLRGVHCIHGVCR